MAHLVKNPPVMQETQVCSLGWEEPWRREWQPTPVFLLAEFHEQKSLEGYSQWGRKELNMTEQLCFHFHESMNTGRRHKLPGSGKQKSQLMTAEWPK